MLDHRAFAKDPETPIRGLQRRGVPESEMISLTTLVHQRSEAIQAVESLRHQLNEASEEVRDKAKAGDGSAVQSAREALKKLKTEIKDREESQKTAESKLEELLLTLPNLPDDSVPDGADESANRIELEVGTKPVFDFEPRAHWALGESLGILDFERAAKLSGSRFVVLMGAGARLERALMAFMLDEARSNGYLEILPPLLVRRETMVGSGQYPKFEGESFETLESEYALIPTSEVPLVNLHRDEILEETQLPLRYCAFTPCFRREAGAAGKDTRGLIRQHQFNKVELVSITREEDSFGELERLTANAASILDKLGLAYRKVSLCTADLSFASAKTYDLEVWLPGQSSYREISSCSNCTDFQARRAQIRYRPLEEGKKPKPKLAHTLNGSGLAIGPNHGGTSGKRPAKGRLRQAARSPGSLFRRR